MNVLCIIGRPIVEIGTSLNHTDVFKGMVYGVKRAFKSFDRTFYVLQGRDEKTAYDSASFIDISVKNKK